MTAARRIQRWIWPLIYVGIFLLALGLSVQRGNAELGRGIAATGIAAMVVGIVLIWIRSRLKEDPPGTP